MPLNVIIDLLTKMVGKKAVSWVIFDLNTVCYHCMYVKHWQSVIWVDVFIKIAQLCYGKMKTAIVCDWAGSHRINVTPRGKVYKNYCLRSLNLRFLFRKLLHVKRVIYQSKMHCRKLHWQSLPHPYKSFSNKTYGWKNQTYSTGSSQFD